MNVMTKALLAGAGLLAVTATTASAAVVCNRDGDCWRVRGTPDYRPEFRLSIHPDNWRWRKEERYRWRNAGRGHGYYEGGRWIVIR